LTLSQFSVPLSNRTDRHDWPFEGLEVHAARQSKFAEEQMAYALKQAELGLSVDEVCRKMGISSATF
jgi:Transposase